MSELLYGICEWNLQKPHDLGHCFSLDAFRSVLWNVTQSVGEQRACLETSSQSSLLFCHPRLQISTLGHVHFCCLAGDLSDMRLFPEWTDELCYYGLTWIFFDYYLASLFPVFCQPVRFLSYANVLLSLPLYLSSFISLFTGLQFLCH